MTLRRPLRTTAWALALAALGAARVASAEPPNPQAVRGAELPTPPATPVGGGLIKDGQPPALFLLYTGDVIGYLEPCG